MNTSIMIVGVGGQGTLLASRILGNMAIKKGFDVKVSEVHGMSQRGGSVVTYVRFGEEKIESPIIEKGGADIIMAFEKLEAYRNLPYLKEGGTMLLNSREIDPMPVIIGDMKYPGGIMEDLEKRNINLKAIDALELAKKAGTVKALNLVLIGLLSKSLPFAEEEWIEVISETVPEKFREMNINAFKSGRE